MNREERRARKAGRDFERAVGEILHHFFRESKITTGHWVVGPDGRRELDVFVEAEVDGQTRTGVIECKDYNPAKQRPIGIDVVDALESKRRDLGLDIAMICSNVGFTEPAIHKAQRTKIGLLGATRDGDNRIRFDIVERIQFRHIRFEPLRVEFRFLDPTTRFDSVIDTNDISFSGGSVGSWIALSFTKMLAQNPVVRGCFQHEARLLQPIELEWPGGRGTVDRISWTASIEGAWYTQSVRLSAAAGFYDWVRRKMKLAPGVPKQHLTVHGLNVHEGKWVPRPDGDPISTTLLPHEVAMHFVLLNPSPILSNPADLDPWIAPEDLVYEIKDFRIEDSESVEGLFIAPQNAHEP